MSTITAGNVTVSCALSADTTGNLVFQSGGNVTAMTIDTSQNVGIGTSSPSVAANYKGLIIQGSTTTAGGVLQLQTSDSSYQAQLYTDSNGTTISSTGNYPMRFQTNGSERARIDSSGNFLVGTTSGAGRLRVERSDNADVSYIVNTNGSFTQDMLRLEASRAATNAFNLIRARSNGVDQFFVSGNGVIYAQNTTVQSASDIRMKENIRESEAGLNVISALRPVRYDFKQGFGNDRKNQLGFIAQEVEPVFPDAVGEFLQNDESYKSVGPGALIPVLVKAIQEQQQMIEELKAEVAALKGASA